MRIKILFIFCLLVIVNIDANAFGLGRIEVKSSLNEPFEASIELTGTLDFDESQVKILLGSNADFERMGINRESVLLQLRFEPQLKSKPPIILIRSEKPIREPALNFIVNVQSPKGQIMKKYAVFLNPAN